jgi:hypothetical protein
MNEKLTEGAPVRVIDREPTPADLKSNLFYNHYRGVSGELTKLYPDGTALVTVDLETLPPAVRDRHKANTDSQRQKWLDGLSEEGRNRLSAAERKFALRYSILVSAQDLWQGDSAPASSGRKTLEEIEAAEAHHLDQVAKGNTA